MVKDYMLASVPNPTVPIFQDQTRLFISDQGLFVCKWSSFEKLKEKENKGMKDKTE